MVEGKLVERQEVSAVHQGKIYRAHYYVERGEVIVEALSKEGTIARNKVVLGQVATPDILARLMLTEMIYAGRAVA